MLKKIPEEIKDQVHEFVWSVKRYLPVRWMYLFAPDYLATDPRALRLPPPVGYSYNVLVVCPEHDNFSRDHTRKLIVNRNNYKDHLFPVMPFVVGQREIQDLLSFGHPFISHIVRNGVLLFQDRKELLETPRTPDWSYVKEQAEQTFYPLWRRADAYLKTAERLPQDLPPDMTLLLLHHATVDAYHAILSVFTGLHTDPLNIQTQAPFCNQLSVQLLQLFPHDTTHSRLLNLLENAQVQQFNPGYPQASEEDLQQLVPIISKLVVIASLLCTTRIHQLTGLAENANH